MSKFVYKELEKSKHEELINRFVEAHGDDHNGIIPNEEFDKLFDLLAQKFGEIGKFVEDGTFDGEDFSASRYVDQLPFIDIVVDGSITPKKLIETAMLVIEQAHRPMGIGFDFETDYIVVFPEKKSIGTIDSSKLQVPIP